ncbi:MAG: hypothetical protein V4509_01940 [Patescibacteria group bacterium]
MAFNNAVDANQQGVQYLSSAGVWTGLDGSTAGDILTSNGTGVAPSFQAGGGGGGGVTSIDPENIGPLTGALSLYGSGTPGQNSYGQLAFQALSSSEITLTIGDNTNLILGLGSGGLNQPVLGVDNVGLGLGVLTQVTNSGVDKNVAVGRQAGQFAFGSYNVFLGYASGVGFTGNSSIGLGDNGNLNGSNTLQIGGSTGTGNGQLAIAYICGIAGATYTGSSPTPRPIYLNSFNDQLVSTEPTDSNTLTATFGSSITAGSPVQNTFPFPIYVNISVDVTVAVSGSVVMSVSSDGMGATNPVTGTITAATMVNFGATIPSGWFLLVDVTGTLTVGSITTQANPMG